MDLDTGDMDRSLGIQDHKRDSRRSTTGSPELKRLEVENGYTC